MFGPEVAGSLLSSLRPAVLFHAPARLLQPSSQKVARPSRPQPWGQPWMSSERW